MPIEKFRIINAGPFDDITFEFDERVNVFVGPNNSGKSAALLALAETAVYPFIFPTKFIKPPGSQWELDLSVKQQKRLFSGMLPIDLSQEAQEPKAIELLSSIGFTAFIPSLRRSTDYRSKGPSIHPAEQLRLHNLEDDDKDVETNQMRGVPTSHFRNVPRHITESNPELHRRRRLLPTDAALVSDQWVIQKMVDLDYAGYRRNQPQIHNLLKKVTQVASEITEGYHLGFSRISEDEKGLFPEFQTIDGDLPLNVLSQGTQSTIQWLSHFLFGYAQYYDYPKDLEDKPGILIVDEIDVHLHPSWQRRIIPALLNNFPNLQLFCSTHSPLMLSGLKEGQLQLLKRDADGKITASSNWQDMAGWSAEEILRSVLEVRDTMDLTTASEIDRMGELSIKTSLSDAENAELKELQQRVAQALGSGPESSIVELALRHIKQIYSESRLDHPDKPRPRVRRKESESV